VLQVDLKLVVASPVRGQVYLSTADEESLAYDGVGTNCRGRSRTMMGEQEERT